MSLIVLSLIPTDEIVVNKRETQPAAGGLYFVQSDGTQNPLLPFHVQGE